MMIHGKRDHHPLRHGSAGLSRDVWFLLFVLALGVGTIFVLSRLAALLTQPGIHVSVTQRPVQQHLYPFPDNTGPMQPAVDAQGNIWIGEMYANRLAWLNTRTGTITVWQVPHGQDGIMDTAIGPPGKIWFVEQDADYIGRFDPTTHAFRIFPLGKVHGHAVGPQDLQFDHHGDLWFSGPSGGCIGVLHPQTGKIQMWSVPPPQAGTPAIPYSLTLTASGQVRFGYLTGSALGHFDPATHHITLYHLPHQNVQIFSMATDVRG